MKSSIKLLVIIQPNKYAYKLSITTCYWQHVKLLKSRIKTVRDWYVLTMECSHSIELFPQYKKKILGHKHWAKNKIS